MRKEELVDQGDIVKMFRDKKRKAGERKAQDWKGVRCWMCEQGHDNQSHVLGISFHVHFHFFHTKMQFVLEVNQCFYWNFMKIKSINNLKYTPNFKYENTAYTSHTTNTTTHTQRASQPEHFVWPCWWIKKYCKWVSQKSKRAGQGESESEPIREQQYQSQLGKESVWKEEAEWEI